MTGAGPWRVVLTDRAESDFRDMLRWTEERFGRVQALRYAAIVADAISALGAGPDVPGARRRRDLPEGVHSLHVARGGNRGRHVVIFRVESSDVISVLRALHDAMDIVRQMPDDERDE